MIDAVLFDLDDTLFEQRLWLRGAWDAVAAAGTAAGLDAQRLRDALDAVAREGSDRGRIIDRALALVGGPSVDVAPLVDAFRGHRPAKLRAYDGVHELLDRLRLRAPVALVSDGDPAIQCHKLAALGLDDVFDVIVLSDSFGRAARKPNPFPFVVALGQLGVEPNSAVYVGDRPDKDVRGAVAAGMRAVRVRSGEYCDVPDAPGTWATLDDLSQLEGVVSDELCRRVTPAARREVSAR